MTPGGGAEPTKQATVDAIALAIADHFGRAFRVMGKPAGRTRRIDLIRSILETHGGRMKTKDLARELAGEEEADDVPYSAIYIAIAAENERLQAQGRGLGIRTRRDGEVWGWVSLAARTESTQAREIQRSIEAANDRVDGELRKALQSMDWRTFESTFLQQVLERLGFQDVAITQATRDGGVDARATYTRGVVEAKAIVSAKQWRTTKVPVSEVRNMRGIKGEEDTAIIVTTGKFSDDAKDEARPGQNQRVVFLIDGDRLIEVCKENRIGVREAKLPQLLEVDPLTLAPGLNDDEAAENGDETEEPIAGVRRFRDEMLGDDERGLSAAQVARLLDLEESTVRSYLSNEDRKASLGDRIRADDGLRARALAIIAKKRGLES